MDSSEAKESLKSGHRLPATVVPEDELVQVDLELAAAYAVVGANEPLLQVTYGSVGQRHRDTPLVGGPRTTGVSGVFVL